MCIKPLILLVFFLIRNFLLVVPGELLSILFAPLKYPERPCEFLWKYAFKDVDQECAYLRSGFHFNAGKAKSENT